MNRGQEPYCAAENAATRERNFAYGWMSGKEASFMGRKGQGHRSCILEANETLRDESAYRPSPTTRLLTFRVGAYERPGNTTPWSKADVRALLTEESLAPVDVDAIIGQSNALETKGESRSQMAGDVRRRIDYSSPAVYQGLFFQNSRRSTMCKASESKSPKAKSKANKKVSKSKKDLRNREQTRKSSPRILPYADQDVEYLTKQEIAAAIPESASAIFHIMGRRVNLDQHTPNSSLYSLVRSWVHDDPYRTIPPPSLTELCCVDSMPSAITSPQDKKKPAQPSSTGETIPDQSEDKSAPEAMDILSLLKGNPPTTSNRDGLVHDMISRGRRVRSRDRKANADRATATRISIMRKGIMLLPKCK
jgi:hypothetical protein